MKASIVRFETSELGMLGILQIDGHFFCFTFERDHDDPKYKPIPVGSYSCKWHVGTKYRTWEVMDVPGRSEILFHIGNWEKDTEGCILLGMWPMKGEGVSRSREAYQAFMETTKGLPGFELTVRECFA